MCSGGSGGCALVGCSGGGVLVGVLWCGLAGVLRVLWRGGLVGAWLVLLREGRRRRTGGSRCSGWWGCSGRGAGVLAGALVGSGGGALVGPWLGLHRERRRRTQNERAPTSAPVLFVNNLSPKIPTQNLGLRLRLALVRAGWCSALVGGALVVAPGALVGVLWWGCRPAGALAGSLSQTSYLTQRLPAVSHSTIFFDFRCMR